MLLIDFKANSLRLVNDFQAIISVFESDKYLFWINPLFNNSSSVSIQSLLEEPVSQYSVANYTKIGGRSSAIRTGSRLEGVADNAQ